MVKNASTNPSMKRRKDNSLKKIIATAQIHKRNLVNSGKRKLRSSKMRDLSSSASPKTVMNNSASMKNSTAKSITNITKPATTDT